MLKKYYPYEYINSVFDIDYKKLYEIGYRCVIFDIDATLVYHGDDSNEKIDNLFKEIHSIGLKTLLLSNNDEERILRFIKNIDTEFICDANKPDTAGYHKAVEIMGIDNSQAVFVGDQVFTDICGANNSGMANILVKFLLEPGETKLGIKRNLEKVILFFYKHSKKNNNRLGGIAKEGN